MTWYSVGISLLFAIYLLNIFLIQGVTKALGQQETLGMALKNVLKLFGCSTSSRKTFFIISLGMEVRWMGQSMKFLFSSHWTSLYCHNFSKMILGGLASLSVILSLRILRCVCLSPVSSSILLMWILSHIIFFIIDSSSQASCNP